MENPWGISGPEFIWLYIGLLVLPLLVRISWGTAATGTRTVAEAGKQPTVYELAYLAGGADRVVETAIAALFERGQLRLSSKNKIHPAGAKPADPLERAVAGSGGLTSHGIKRKLRTSSQMKALVAGLERSGLIVAGGKVRTIQRAVFGMYVVVLGIGIARWVNGAALHRPIGWLSVLVIAAAVATMISRGATKKHADQSPTRDGSNHLSQARHRSLTYAAGAAGVVALGGLAMYPDIALGASLTEPERSSVFGSGSGGWSGSSDGGGGSSCGGGGCGGGGGGGCGG